MIKTTIISLLSILCLASCSSYRVNEEAQAKEVKAELPADTPQQMAMRAAEIFSNAPNLSDEQKKQLHTIYTNVYEEAMTIRREIGQNKSWLNKTLVKSDYKSSEVNTLKNKIVALDKKRLNIMFKALKDVQKIVGQGPDKENIYKHLSNYERFK